MSSSRPWTGSSFVRNHPGTRPTGRGEPGQTQSSAHQHDTATYMRRENPPGQAASHDAKDLKQKRGQLMTCIHTGETGQLGSSDGGQSTVIRATGSRRRNLTPPSGLAIV